MVTAIVFDVQLESPGIHTRRHFAGELLTHPFFSREALHASLFDIWEPFAPTEYVPDTIPYGSTPLFAADPGYVTLHYASKTGWTQTGEKDPHLTVGTMQGMAPGTLLRGAVWGDPAELPDIFEGRGFAIGKRRATARVIRCARKDVRVGTTAEARLQLPVQIARDRMLDPEFRPAIKRIVATHRYIVADVKLTSQIPRFVLDGIAVPALDYFGSLDS